ncbi:hypothetical protein KAU45_07035 [bacterium]|nr:hypothetical protein [bacterium]
MKVMVFVIPLAAVALMCGGEAIETVEEQPDASPVETAAPTYAGPDYYPLEVGARWVFHSTKGYNAGKESYSYTVVERSDDSYRAIATNECRYAGMRFYVRENGRVYLDVLASSIHTARGMLILDMTREKGYRWDGLTEEETDQIPSYTIGEKGAHAATGFDEYDNCIVVEQHARLVRREGEWIMRTVYAPDVGPVILEDEHYERREELSSYWVLTEVELVAWFLELTLNSLSPSFRPDYSVLDFGECEEETAPIREVIEEAALILEEEDYFTTSPTFTAKRDEILSMIEEFRATHTAEESHN